MFAGDDGASAAPRNVGRCLASGVRELNACDRALRFHELHDGSECARMFFRPDAAVPCGDASGRRDGARLDEDETGAAHRAAAEVNVMPFVGQAALARVLAHRRDEDAISERDLAKRVRREEVRHQVWLVRSARPRNAATRLLTCSLASKFAMCPARAIGASSALGSSAAMRSASLSGVISSRSPAITNAGIVTLLSVSAESGRAAIAFSAAITPGTDAVSMMRRTSARQASCTTIFGSIASMREPVP